jgi:hypothetical protein
LLPILASGKNVVSPIGSPMHWRHLADGQAFLGEIAAACRRGRSTAFFTGIDPGFSESVLEVGLASLVGKITQIRTREMIDYTAASKSDVRPASGVSATPISMPHGTMRLRRRSPPASVGLLPPFIRRATTAFSRPRHAPKGMVLTCVRS